MPFQWPDANAFNNYYSPYNALRIAKGAAWAWLFFSLSRRVTPTPSDRPRAFAVGMIIGLAMTVAVVLWERMAFSGLLNFADDYRVTGPFSATHTGGPYIDSFIAIGLPFLIAALVKNKHWLIRLPGALLLVAATYALLVTFSRAGYAAFAVAALIMLISATTASMVKFRSGAIIVGIIAAMSLVALPVFKGQFFQSRIATIGTDLNYRIAQWQTSLNLMDPGWATSLIGMGVGRFPQTNYWRGTHQPKAANYQLAHDAGNTYLRLDAGDATGVEQFVTLQPGTQYTLKMAVRPSKSGSKISVPICEKWLLTSETCIGPGVDLGDTAGIWRNVEMRFTNQTLLPQPWYATRPVKLALSYGVPLSTIDIDNVRLEDPQGHNQLQNSEFSDGLDHWFFATAVALHSHWRVHNLYVGVLFDQGWFGLLALMALLALAQVRAAQKVWHGNTLAGAPLAALSGFMVGGVFDNPIDTPRMLLLMLLLAWSCLKIQCVNLK
jgi:O-antigen ligase